MPQNFGSNFLRGFGGTFPRTFDTSFRYGLQKQEDDAIAQKTAEYDKRQQDILGQVIANVTVDPKSFQGGMPSIRPLSQEEQFNLYSKASPQTQNTIEQIWKQREPKTLKKKEYQSFGDNLYEKDPVTGELNKEPILTKPEDIAWIEETSDATYEYRGHPGGKEGDVGIRMVKGQPMTVKGVQITHKPKTVTDGNGRKEQQFGEFFVKEIDKRIKTLFESDDIRKSAQSGKYYIDPLTGKQIRITTDTANKMYSGAKIELQNFLDNQLGSDGSWDNTLAQIKNIAPEDIEPTLWKTILENYKNKSISNKTFQEWRYRYISEFGFDPISRFGMK